MNNLDGIIILKEWHKFLVKPGFRFFVCYFSSLNSRNDIALSGKIQCKLFPRVVSS